MKKRFFAMLLCLLTAFPLLAGAAAPASAGEMQDALLAACMAQSGAADVQDWLDGAIAKEMGMGGEWYVLALSQHGSYDLSACRDGLLAYLDAHTVRSATTRQKLALTLLACGVEDGFVLTTLEDSIGQQGVMSWAWGLHLLNNGCVSQAVSAQEAIQTLLEMRKADGGWAVTGDHADVDVTAMVLQALAPYTDQAEVAEAVEAALTLLSGRQLPDGDFASYGVSCPESTAQVMIALSALRIDALTDERFIQNGATLLDGMARYRLADGRYSHTLGGEPDANATMQVLLALTAYERFTQGKPSLYLLDGEATALERAGEAHAAWSYKGIACCGVLGAAALACILLLFRGKRHAKNFLAVALLALTAIAFVLLTDFQSADDYYVTQAVEKTDAIGQVTLSIRCDTVAGQAAHIPEDGVILAPTVLPIAAGDTVYTLLTDAARLFGVHMEASGSAGMMYIQGIANLYEFDFGDLSGWVYLVNGEEASVGCSQYVLAPGDTVEWHYTCALGNDLK